MFLETVRNWLTGPRPEDLPADPYGDPEPVDPDEVVPLVVAWPQGC